MVLIKIVFTSNSASIKKARKFQIVTSNNRQRSAWKSLSLLLTVAPPIQMKITFLLHLSKKCQSPIQSKHVWYCLGVHSFLFSQKVKSMARCKMQDPNQHRTQNTVLYSNTSTHSKSNPCQNTSRYPYCIIFCKQTIHHEGRRTDS